LILTETQSGIVQTILYFDIFRCPLTVQELYNNLIVPCSLESFDKALIRLLEAGMLKRHNGYILSINGTEADIPKREKGMAVAKQMLPVAEVYSRKIASFPFVECVCLSGGLSKNYYDEKSDIDYFIVSKPGRLWLCRTILILRYKLMPAAKKKYWCTNYFISSDNLKIPESNVFTATELAYLIPVFNYGMYQQLLDGNNWYRKFYPNKKPAGQDHVQQIKNNKLKVGFEHLFSGWLGDTLDDLLQKFTLKHWRRKYPDLNEEDFELQFRSRKDACKRHTFGYQNKILEQLQKRKQEFEQRFGLQLN
jgi:hypothetical protein